MLFLSAVHSARQQNYSNREPQNSRRREATHGLVPQHGHTGGKKNPPAPRTSHVPTRRVPLGPLGPGRARGNAQVNWTIQSNGTKKELVLQGFRLLPEWEDTVGGKIRTRVWTTGHSLEKDSEWMRQYNAQVRLDKLSARSTQADSAASGRT